MSEWPRTWVVKVNTDGEGEKKTTKETDKLDNPL